MKRDISDLIKEKLDEVDPSEVNAILHNLYTICVLDDSEICLTKVVSVLLALNVMVLDDISQVDNDIAKQCGDILASITQSYAQNPPTD